MKTKFADVQVRIPNLEGDAVAETHTISVPVTVDPHTGEELLTEEAVELIETTKARYMGLLLPAEIKALRQRLQLTQKQMSELLQAGEKSYTRWESGNARPSRMVNLLLRLLYEGKVSVEALRSVGRPRSAACEIRLETVGDCWQKAIAAMEEKWQSSSAEGLSNLIRLVRHNYAVQRCWDDFLAPPNQPGAGLISVKRNKSDYYLQKNSTEYRSKFGVCDPDEAIPTSA